jgi:hypothetical protein
MRIKDSIIRSFFPEKERITASKLKNQLGLFRLNEDQDYFIYDKEIFKNNFWSKLSDELKLDLSLIDYKDQTKEI